MRNWGPITAEDFKTATGREPIQDDLERCNCPEAGAIGHFVCGWDDARGMPNFIPGPRMIDKAKAAGTPSEGQEEVS